jgi:hypothetical protein
LLNQAKALNVKNLIITNKKDYEILKKKQKIQKLEFLTILMN